MQPFRDLPGLESRILTSVKACRRVPIPRATGRNRNTFKFAKSGTEASVCEVWDSCKEGIGGGVGAKNLP